MLFQYCKVLQSIVYLVYELVTHTLLFAQRLNFLDAALCLLLLHFYLLQDDWDSYVAFTPKVGKDVQVVGDDLTVTNPIKIKEAVEKGACNALLLKVNQVSTIAH
jgi:Enolase, C-terminal TIM barrel domain